MKIEMSLIPRQCLINFICCLCLFSFYGDEVSTSKEGLPFCGVAESSSRFIFISTLDGKLTALNPNNNGAILWTIHPRSESMLSSNIHKLELSNYGHLIRMIPSLSGGLYKFNGENIEAIPVTIDHLLQSSLKYSDDIVISGGKETHTFGVSLESGNIIYECSMKSCTNITHSTTNGEVLVIQRQTQTVRAVEPRTGTERWNFSVGQHDLKFVSSCHSPHNSELNFQLKIIIPEGVIYAVDAKNPKIVFWKQKFNSPIVNAWQLNQGKIFEVDLFNSESSIASPSLYIGMHEKQLYIQENIEMLKRRNELNPKINHNAIMKKQNYPIIPWKPVPATIPALGITWEEDTKTGTILDDGNSRETTALSVLYASSYVDGNGFFLYEDTDKISDKNSFDSIDEDEYSSVINSSEPKYDEGSENASDIYDVNTPVEIVIVSLWYYWKEILVIIGTTVMICHLMITRTYRMWELKNLSRLSNSRGSNTSQPTAQENESTELIHVNQFEQNPKTSVQDYVSRYLTDFEPVACLGKGGFGVVFEAKNKIDDCRYAIKRILLPNRQESRDRVMREVKALAKLDHHHIVRYFNAWTECPPSGWQESHDKFWLQTNQEQFTSSDLSYNATNMTNQKESELSQFQKSGFSHSVLSSDSILSITDNIERINFSNDGISDSFIVFDNKTESDNFVNSTSVDKKFKNTVESSSLNSKKLSQTRNADSAHDFVIDSERTSKVYLYIQMQLCQRHSLRDWLTANLARDYTHVLSIFEQILQAVEHLHLHGLIHRDLKPSNIFFSLDNQIKVGDFGLVTAMTEDIQALSADGVTVGSQNERHTAQVGTHLYMSQELLQGKPYNYKVDIYSLGLILFELLVPFSTQMERIVELEKLKKDKFSEAFQKSYRREFDLLRLMLSNSPEERPTTYGIRARLPLKQHPVEENWHFELPTRTSFKTSSSKSSSQSSKESQ